MVCFLRQKIKFIFSPAVRSSSIKFQNTGYIEALLMRKLALSETLMQTNVQKEGRV